MSTSSQKIPVKLPISLVVITLNEELNIERCLKSVPWAEDIVILDSGSHDRTCEIARNLGARVFQEDWRGYGRQKQRATELANCDWVLSLDADEKLSTELSDEIQSKWTELNPEIGYRLPRKSFYLGRWILHGGWYPDYQLRLYQRKFSAWKDLEIHEHVVAKSTQTLIHPIEHYVFKDVAHQVATNNKYSGLQAQSFVKNGGQFSMFKLITKPVSKFLECYFFKRGFCDGMPGLLIAVSAGYSVFIRWAKIWEFSKGKKS